MLGSRTRRAGLSAVAVLVVTRAFAGCSSDDTVAPESPPVDDGGAEAAPSPASSDAAVSDAALPSLCRGLVMVGTFDQGFALDRGDASLLPTGAATPAPSARFQGGASLVSAGDDAGAALYVVGGDAGTPVVPQTEGTIAIWVRGLPSPPPGGFGSAVIFRAVGTLPPEPLASSGLILAHVGGSTFGLFHVAPGNAGASPVLTAATPEVRPFFRPDGFNHVVASWRRGDAGPTARLTVNGGLGERLDPDAAAFDAGRDAGDPMAFPRASSNVPWFDDVYPVALRLGGPWNSAAESVVDDLAVWDRMLDFGEVADLYRHGASVADVCLARAPVGP